MSRQHRVKQIREREKAAREQKVESAIPAGQVRPLYSEMSYRELQAEAKARGIKSFGVRTADLVKALEVAA